jgi:hypothetical protein
MSYSDGVAEGLKWRMNNRHATREEISTRAEAFATAWENDSLLYAFLAGVRRADG